MSPGRFFGKLSVFRTQQDKVPGLPFAEVLTESWIQAVLLIAFDWLGWNSLDHSGFCPSIAVINGDDVFGEPTLCHPAAADQRASSSEHPQSTHRRSTCWWSVVRKRPRRKVA